MNIAVRPDQTPAERPGDTPEQIGLPGFNIASCAVDQPSLATAEPETSTEFDWLTEDCVVVEEQPPIAVYRNKRNHLVIRSRGPGDDEDGFVFIGTPDSLKLLITALQRELREWR